MMAETSERMLHTDAFSWYMESDPGLRSTVVAVALADRAPDWEYLKQRVERATRLVPHFRAVVEPPPWRLGPPRWIVDERFSIDYHMRRIVLPEPADWDAVLAQARLAAMSDFDRDRPLWELTLLEGLPDGKAAIMTKMHHSLTDGIGGIDVLGLIIDGTREMAPLADLPIPGGSSTGVVSTVWSTLRDNSGDLASAAKSSGAAILKSPAAVVHPMDTAGVLWRATRSVARVVQPILRQASPLMTERRMIRELATIDVPLDDLRRAAARCDGHLNDAFLAGVTGGLRRYHSDRDVEIGELRVTMPVSVRRPGDGLGGNRITLLRFALPAGLADPAERIAAIARTSRAWQREPALAYTQPIAFALNLVPRSYIQGVLRRVDFVASDVPGLTGRVYVAGARIEAYYPFGPTIGTALNATLMSYVDMCNIGLNVDTGAVPDVADLVGHLRDGFDEVLALAKHRAKAPRPATAAG